MNKTSTFDVGIDGVTMVDEQTAVARSVQKLNELLERLRSWGYVPGASRNVMQLPGVLYTSFFFGMGTGCAIPKGRLNMAVVHADRLRRDYYVLPEFHRTIDATALIGDKADAYMRRHDAAWEFVSFRGRMVHKMHYLPYTGGPVVYKDTVAVCGELFCYSDGPRPDGMPDIASCPPLITIHLTSH